MTKEQLTQEAIELLKHLEEKYGKIPIHVMELAISLFWHSEAVKNT
jgi:hypothetical protein